MKPIDYAKYEGHTEDLTVETRRDICDEFQSTIPQLQNILVTDWSDADLALHSDAPSLLAACKERDERIKELEAVLRHIEFQPYYDADIGYIGDLCSVCEGTPQKGHEHSCMIGIALKEGK